MKKLLFTLFAIVSIVAVNAQTSDKIITEKIPVDIFSSLNVSGIYDVTLIKSDECSVEITYNSIFEKYIDISVSSETLHLTMKQDFFTKLSQKKVKNKNYNIKVIVKIKELKNLTMSGASKLTTSAQFNAENFMGKFSGASMASGLNLSGNNLKIMVSGASNVEMKENFTSASISLSGASNAKMEARNNETNITLSGASNLQITGKSDNNEIKVSGASSLRGFEFINNEIDITASGSTCSWICAEKKINVSSSGTSKIEYKGNPTIINEKSGSTSSVRKK